MSRNSTYQIIAKFEGTASIVNGYRQIQAEARRTSRAIIDGARSEQRAITEARRREAQATREAARAQRDAQRAQQRVWLEARRLRAEDLAHHRRYIADLRKQQDHLREDRRKAMQQAGIGLAGLALVGGGVRKAGSFEDALHGLRTAFQEAGEGGAVDIARLNDQMKRAGEIGIDLGNKLQGTTQDYLEIFAALRKSGVDIETILTGAGRAAGYLANVSGSITAGNFREQAEELGQFGMLFNLRPEEFEAQVNIFSALRDRFNVESSSLIESAKYFQATAASLNLTGLAGATDTTKVFALLKRRGALEGGQAGTGLTSFFSHFITHKKEVDKLRKETGIDLKFFDEKGQFKGFESLFAQMAEFRKLSSEQRSASLFKIFGEQGAKAAGVMVEAGAEGWADIGTEMKKAVPVAEKINQQMSLFNSKLEAVQGSAENLVVKSFTPMLEGLKPLLDVANTGLGKLTDFAGEHPRMAKFATTVLTIGSAYMVVRGGVRAASASLGLWRVATRLAAAENALLTTSLRTTGTAALVAGRQIGFTSTMTRAGTVGTLGSRLGTGLGRGLVGGMMAVGLGMAFHEWMQSEEMRAKAEAAGDQLGALLAERMQAKLAGTNVLQEFDKVNAAQIARLTLEKQNVGDLGQDPLSSLFGSGKGVLWGEFQKSLNEAYVADTPGMRGGAMNAIKDRLRQSGIASAEVLKEYLAQASDRLAEAGRSELFTPLYQAAKEVYPELMAELSKQGEANKKLQTSADLAARSVGGLAAELNRMRLSSYVPTPSYTPQPPSPLFGPKKGGLDTSGFGLKLFAEGGIATRPTLGLFGERGPEAVMPLSKLGQFGGVNISNLTLAVTLQGGADGDGVGQLRRALPAVADELAELIESRLQRKGWHNSLME